MILKLKISDSNWICHRLKNWKLPSKSCSRLKRCFKVDVEAYCLGFSRFHTSTSPDQFIMKPELYPGIQKDHKDGSELQKKGSDIVTNSNVTEFSMWPKFVILNCANFILWRHLSRDLTIISRGEMIRILADSNIYKSHHLNRLYISTHLIMTLNDLFITPYWPMNSLNSHDRTYGKRAPM